MKCLRVQLIWKDQGASRDDKFFIDLYVDDDGVTHKQLTFLGWMTSENHGLHPFRLTKDGKIDFGSEYAEQERWSATNIRSKKIARGEYATFDIEGSSYIYQITQIDDLAAL